MEAKPGDTATKPRKPAAARARRGRNGAPGTSRAGMTRILVSGLQDCEKIKLCCSKPLSLQHSPQVAPGNQYTKQEEGRTAHSCAEMSPADSPGEQHGVAAGWQ